MLRLHSYILWSMLKFFHKKSQHYILCMIYIYIYKGGGTHTVVCTAHLYSAKHPVVFIWSSWGVKITQPLLYFHYFFNIKFTNFNCFQKRILQKMSEMFVDDSCREPALLIWNILILIIPYLRSNCLTK